MSKLKAESKFNADQVVNDLKKIEHFYEELKRRSNELIYVYNQKPIGIDLKRVEF